MMVMAKKKIPEPAKPKRRGLHVQAYLDDDMSRAFSSFVKAQRIEPSSSTVVVTALMELLQREGFWPPPQPQ